MLSTKDFSWFKCKKDVITIVFFFMFYWTFKIPVVREVTHLYTENNALKKDIFKGKQCYLFWCSIYDLLLLKRITWVATLPPKSQSVGYSPFSENIIAYSCFIYRVNWDIFTQQLFLFAYLFVCVFMSFLNIFDMWRIEIFINNGEILSINVLILLFVVLS